MTVQTAANNLMTSCPEYPWGWIVNYLGTRDELLAANIVGPNAFILPKSGVAKGIDEYGNTFQIKRRVRGLFKVEKDFCREQRQVWFRKYGKLSDIDVTPILQKFAK